MTRPPLLPDRPNYLTDPARARFRAAMDLRADAGPPWIMLDAMPEGEVIWREDNDSVTLTPDGWLVYVNRGKAEFYSRKVRATPERIAALRGTPETTKPPAKPEAPVGRDVPGSEAARARGCTCPKQTGELWTVDPDCPLHGYGAG